ncbi:MAG TPA: dihydropteroate synthase [Candidatus Limnocylindrales bacterium]|nr:dihydropteroate synthase [Candidatus Limnocylindrales bacterium]
MGRRRVSHPAPTTIGSRTFTWGARTFVMGIVNMTPDSFSGDGLLAGAGARSATHADDDHVAAAVAQALEMAKEGADLLDIGAESTRPGHAAVPETEELRRVIPVLRAVRAALPELPITIDTTKPGVAMAALQHGADAINDIWGVGEDDALTRLAAETGVPIVLMHNRAEPRYANVIAEVVADLRRAVERALDAGVPAANVIVDPGIGFGKTAEQNLEVLRELGALRTLGRPILLGASRKSTLGKVLDGLPPEDRIEATVAATALGIAAGVDIVRVHDVRENVRAARMADAVVRGTWHDPAR